MKPALILFVLFIHIFAAKAQTTPPEETDSVLFNYYQWCNAHRQDSVVLLKADTMLRIATEKQDQRMQCVAMTFKADYYYFNNNLDSLKAWVPRVQAFARERDQLKYYYFIWSRLILYHTKNNHLTLAQYELKQYLAQADADDYKPATADAYIQLANIYQTQFNERLAADYYRKGIDYILENDLNQFSLYNSYASLTQMLIYLNEFGQASDVLEEGRKHILLPEKLITLELQQTNLHIRTGKLGQARSLLKQISDKPASDANRYTLLTTEIALLRAEGKNDQALSLLNTLIDEYRRVGLTEQYYSSTFSTRAEIQAHRGAYEAAYRDLSHYVYLYRQKVTEQTQTSLSEFATLLDVARLNSDKAQLQQRAQAERLRLTYIIISALATILALAAALIIVQTRTNRRLARAKRAVEESDRMKGIFIRNITHEINTPLNAIVGFAELASNAPADSEDRLSYIDIIQENSGYLQKLVNDVLYISDIESSDTPPVAEQVDINRCCIQCIEAVGLEMPEPPQIAFEPGCEALTVGTVRMLLAKTLSELILNATRYAPGSPITLAYTVHAGMLSFTVTDNGPGIPAAEAEHIFDRFVKLDTFSQGLGLGLGVCRLIAQTLKGRIYLDTTYTGGARFIFTIPMA